MLRYCFKKLYIVSGRTSSSVRDSVRHTKSTRSFIQDTHSQSHTKSTGSSIQESQTHRSSTASFIRDSQSYMDSGFSHSVGLQSGLSSIDELTGKQSQWVCRSVGLDCPVYNSGTHSLLYNGMCILFETRKMHSLHSHPQYVNLAIYLQTIGQPSTCPPCPSSSANLLHPVRT